MPRGYRYVLAASAGIAALFAAFGAGLTLGALNYPQQERYQSYRYASDKPIELEAATLREADAKPLEYRTPCSEPKGRDESDLCAQWKAARAAEAGTLWAKLGFWATVAGIIGLLVTIVQSRTALEKAHESNKIAYEGKRAWASVKNMTATVQAYDEYFVGDPQNTPLKISKQRKMLISVSLDIFNSGETPVFNLMCQVLLERNVDECAKWLKHVSDQVSGFNLEQGFCIAPGASFSHNSVYQLKGSGHPDFSVFNFMTGIVIVCYKTVTGTLCSTVQGFGILGGDEKSPGNLILNLSETYGPPQIHTQFRAPSFMT